MEHYLDIVEELRRRLEADKIGLYYRGDFDDAFTNHMISLADHDLGKGPRKRMAYLITESFQNIVRHMDRDLEPYGESSFCVRSRAPYLHIFSSNPVEGSARERLESSIADLNDQNPEQLRENYLKVLEGGEISTKGGAGLGLIEMARRSGGPIQRTFSEGHDDMHQFSMQVDMVTDKKADLTAHKPLGIEHTLGISELMIENKIHLLYTGDFNDSVAIPMLQMVAGNVGQERFMAFSLYHTAVEVMQNISRHGREVDGVKRGLVSIAMTEDHFHVITGNYLKDDGTELQKWIDHLNKLKRSELDDLYRKRLQENVNKEGDHAGVGLIDLRRITEAPINLKVTEAKGLSYAIIDISIKNA